MKYTSLTDDLTFLIKEYQDCFKNSSEDCRYPIRQRAIWAPKGKCQAITQQSIGCDAKNALRLLKECGFDGEAVSTQKSSTVRKWFDGTNEHVFPPQRDIIRLALFFSLDFYHTLHLVLKAGFEQHLIKQDPEYKYLCGKSYIEILSTYQIDANDELDGILHRYHQNLAINEVYQLFEEHWHFASESGYHKEAFKVLVEKMFLKKFIYFENHNPILSSLAEQEKQLIEQLKFGTPESQEELWRKRSIWQVLQDDLDDIYFSIEKARFKSAEVDQNYLRLFGDVIIHQIELKAAIKINELQIGYLRKNPGITNEELEQKIIDTQAKLNAEIKEMKLIEATAKNQASREAWSQCGIPMDREQINKEIDLCKKEIREIRMLVHPDHLENNKEYANLTQAQKMELKDILLDALKITPAELGFPPTYEPRDMRSLEGLRQVRRRVEIILKINNIQVDLQYQIMGETITDQLNWLEKEIKLLENRLNTAKGQLATMLNNSEMMAKKALIESSEKQKEFREEMEKQNLQLEQENEKLEQELEQLKKAR